MAYKLIFLLKKCECLATHIFPAKIPVNLVMYLLEQLTFLTANELVKLTMLWTTGPMSLKHVVDDNTLLWCFQVTEMKSINKVQLKIYLYYVNTLDLYSVCSVYAKNNGSENWK